MALINRVPQGLLGLLDTKTLGKNPDDLSNTIVPTVDLKDLFLVNSGLQQDIVTAAAVTSASLLTPVALVSVPAGELWFVLNVTAEVIVGLSPGADYRVVPILNGPGGFAGAQILQGNGEPTNTTIATGESVSISYNGSPYLVAPPGSEFGSMPVRSFNGASAVTTYVLHYTVQV